MIFLNEVLSILSNNKIVIMPRYVTDMSVTILNIFLLSNNSFGNLSCTIIHQNNINSRRKTGQIQHLCIQS